MVSTNRDMLIAVAGVFFLLPGLIGAVVLPVPQFAKGMDQAQLIEAVTRFYIDTLPWLVVLTLPMLVGYLTVLAMLIDPERPTVGQAIGRAVRVLPGYLAVQILFALAVSIGSGVLMGLLSLAMPQTIASIAALVAMIYPAMRMVLFGPTMMAQHTINPFRAVGQGLALTRGAVIGMTLFFGPALVLFTVIYLVITIIATIALAGVSQPEAQRLGVEAVGAVVLATGYVYLTAMIAAAWRQLDEPAPDA